MPICAIGIRLGAAAIVWNVSVSEPRRKMLESQWEWYWATRFNEAAATMPQRYSTSLRCCFSSACFHEAAARTPLKCQCGGKYGPRLRCIGALRGGCFRIYNDGKHKNLKMGASGDRATPRYGRCNSAYHGMNSDPTIHSVGSDANPLFLLTSPQLEALAAAREVEDAATKLLAIVNDGVLFVLEPERVPFLISGGVQERGADGNWIHHLTAIDLVARSRFHADGKIVGAQPSPQRTRPAPALRWTAMAQTDELVKMRLGTSAVSLIGLIITMHSI